MDNSSKEVKFKDAIEALKRIGNMGSKLSDFNNNINLTENENEKIKNYAKILKVFNNNYLRKLSIMDHLRECLQRYDKYKLESNKKELTYELNKELMDLLILLEIHKNNIGESLYNMRIDSFLDKIAENK